MAAFVAFGRFCQRSQSSVHDVRLLESFRIRSPSATFVISHTSNTRLLVTAFVAHGRLWRHTPLQSLHTWSLLAAFALPAHGRFRASRSSFCLPAVISGIRFRLLPVLGHHLAALLAQGNLLPDFAFSQPSRTRSLVAVIALPLFAYGRCWGAFHSLFAISSRTISFPSRVVPRTFAFSQTSSFPLNVSSHDRLSVVFASGSPTTHGCLVAFTLS